MRQNELKYFGDIQSGRLNADDSPFAVTTNEWINAENVRTGTTDKGATGIMESIGGNVMISQAQPSVTHMTVGAVEDVENSRVVYFQLNTIGNEDKIVCMYTDTNTEYTVLLSSQVTGGLNFDKDSLIHSAKITDNILSWVDGSNNQPRKINLNSAIVANDPTFQTDATPYTFPLNFSEITVIKPPPIFCPNIALDSDPSYVNNFIAENSFEFAFQYQYYDNETTVVGAYSIATRYQSQDSSANVVIVGMDGNEQIPSTVRKVNLIARLTDGNSGGGNDAYVAKTWDREDAIDEGEISDQNDGTQVLTFRFYNNITGRVIAPDDVTRPYDAVPIYSQTHEVARGRYFFGNNTEGYDVPESTSLGVDFSTNAQTSNDIVTLQLYLITLQSVDTVPASKQWAFKGYCVFDGQNYLLRNNTATYTLGSNTLPATPALPSSPVAYTSNFTNIGSNITQIVNNIHPITGRPTGNTTDGTQYMLTRTLTLTGTWLQITSFPLITYGVFAQQAPYKFGVVFYDYAMRKCGVVSPRDKDSYTKIFDYFGTATNPSNAQGTAPNIIASGITNSNILQVGDQIVVSGTGSGLDATWTVSSLQRASANIFVEEQTVPTTINFISPTYPVRIEVYRKLKTELTTPASVPLSSQNSIKWTLSNVNALTEIPDWAYYYTVVRTLNLRTRYFIQNHITGTDVTAKYCKKNADGTWNCSYNTVVAGVEAIGLPINNLIRNGLGYVYEPLNNDMCILQPRNTGGYVGVLNLPVIGQDGNFILVKFADLGYFSSETAGIADMPIYYEVYTPYKPSEQEPYYEVGEIYQVLNPGESNREYQITTGNFRGDCALVERTASQGGPQPAQFKVLGMCANDRFYQRWDNDGGKSNIITNYGQTKNQFSISYSDALISQTEINGTSTFRLGGNVVVPTDCGAITKLQLTSKIQNEGTVMLSICTQEVNSMYLGETQITDSTGATRFFSAGSGVISTINTLKGNYGCISPESVVQYRGRVYFFDANGGRWVQYSENGLDAISNVKMSRFWRNWAYQYLSMTKAEIEAFGDRPYVFATIDAAHDELLISIPKLSNTPPKGFLPDYPSDEYPFDILDYRGKTIVYKLGSLAVVNPHWQGAYTFTVEYFANVQNKLFSFKNGNMYEHNQDNQNQFYGTQYTSKVMFTSNIMPQVPKVYDNFLSESNLVPNFVYFYNEYPYVQASDLVDFSFRNVEGIWYASILRNKIVPTSTGFTTNGLLTAEVMRNTNMYVLVEYSPTTTPLQLRIIQLGMSVSRGHNFK